MRNGTYSLGIRAFGVVDKNVGKGNRMVEYVKLNFIV
jgi:hypothetical protein